MSKVRAGGQETNIQEVGAMAAGRGKDGEEKGSNRFEFTDKSLRGKRITPAAPGRRKFYWDTLLPGFALRVGDAISKERVGTLCLVTRIPGKKSSSARAIGVFPGETTLAGARDLARAMKADIRQGIDPKEKAAKQRREEERRRAETFSAVFEDYRVERLSRIKTGKAVVGDIGRHVIPKWGPRPIAEIRRADVKELRREIDKVAPRTSSLVLSYLKTFFSWATDEERIEANPAAGLRPLSSAVRRDRVMSDAEIRAFWRACDKLGGPFAQCFKFLLATAARRTEAGALRWEELDLEARLWTLPRARSKASQVHTVPLNAIAIDIIKARPKIGPFVFTSAGDHPLSGWSKSKRRLDLIVADEMRTIAAERGDEAAAIPQWGLHDLRRTAATNMSKLGVDRLTVSKVLGHAEGGVTKIYDRHSFDKEKRRALDMWGQRLQSIIDGKTDNVVSIAARR
ncbi:MAG: hypothetical protein CTY30_00830 [Methylocystis sp.]|nr:MAG: hypothetical protein CTY30_00830 [Methylocystis sp.]